jgi:predicted nuclease of predicted toxin-antitoxin system
MSHATALGFVVLTHDLDFGAILAPTGGAKPSVVQVRADNTSPEAIASQVVTALKQSASELTEGALASVDTARARLRVLPWRRV